MGRTLNQPDKLNEDVIEKLCWAIKSVLVISRAFDLIGMDRSNMVIWGKKAETHPDSIYAKVIRAVKKAQAEKIQMLVSNIENRVPGWQANAWLLERCFREDFGSDAGAIQELLKQAAEFNQLMENFKQGKLLYGKAHSSKTQENS